MLFVGALEVERLETVGADEVLRMELSAAFGAGRESGEDSTADLFVAGRADRIDYGLSWFLVCDSVYVCERLRSYMCSLTIMEGSNDVIDE